MEQHIKNQFWFFHDNLEDTCELEGQPAFQISKVLRLKNGDHLILTNGKGQKGIYEILGLEKKSVSLKRISIESFTPLKAMTLVFSLLKGDKTELVIQKAVELGATSICVFEADHSVSRLKENEKKMERYKKIITETLEQCMGVFLPEIHFFKNLKEVLNFLPSHSQVFTLSFDANKSLKDFQLESPVLIIGPEGDFSDFEFKLLENYGSNKIKLCASLLKAETASIAAMAQVHLSRS